MEALVRGFGLIEAPVWDAARGLLFSDVLGGGVFCLGRDNTLSTVFEHRRGIGGMALHTDGGLIVSGRNLCRIKDRGSSNGTFVNGEPVTNADLKQGDVLRCGDIEMVVDRTRALAAR